MKQHEPAVTYEIWERSPQGEERRRMHETGFSTPNGPVRISDDYNAESKMYSKQTGNPGIEYFVVKATTTFEEMK